MSAIYFAKWFIGNATFTVTLFWDASLFLQENIAIFGSKFFAKIISSEILLLISSENLWFSDNFKGNRNYLIDLKLVNILSEI